MPGKYAQQLQLNTIMPNGDFEEDWISSMAWFDKTIDAVHILKDELGVCNVHFLSDGELTYLSDEEGKTFCITGYPGIQTISYNVTPDAPLVGMHGIVDDFSILELGPILYDAQSP